MHLLGGLTINYFGHHMFSYVIADAISNTSLILQFDIKRLVSYYVYIVCLRALLLTIG